MRLLNYIYNNNEEELKNFIINNKLKEEQNILIQIFYATYDKEGIKKLLNLFKNNLNQAKIVGTATKEGISTKGLEHNKTIISFSIFENTQVETYLMEEKDSFNCGLKLICSLKNPKDTDIKAAICFLGNYTGSSENFLNAINSVNSSLIIAGGVARNYIKPEKTLVFTQKGIITNGAVLAALKNPKLKVITDHSFNWEPIGKKHRITKSIKNRVYTIDNIKAIDFYKHYLGEDIEEDLLEITVSLPIVIQKPNITIGRAIIELHEDGSISYAGDIPENTEIRFAYGNINLILEKSKQNISNLSKYPIEAIYIYSCIGRKKAFVNDSIELEIERYNKISEMTGFLTTGEFFNEGKSNNCKNRLLNETLTSLALYEGEEKEVDSSLEIGEPKKELKKYLALNNLISRTSSELEDLTLNLEKRVQEEIKKNEEKEQLLIITQAQAELGYMLEMIAHQWRQPLTVISSTANVIQFKNEMNILEKEETEELINEILDQSNFASETIEDFRELFRLDQVFKKITVYDLMFKIENILKTALITNQIEFKINFNSNEQILLNIPLGQSLQVAINLLKNSIDAIKENKTIKPRITIDVKKDGKNMIFIVEDNGGGIPDNILPKIFEKRFSTKGKTHGTGLGLDICKSIIEEVLKGSINASNSQKNKGAIFEICVPIIVEK